MRRLRERISRHQQDRRDSALPWQTHEVGTQLVTALQQLAAPDRVLLVDCLTLWLTRLLCAEAEVYHEPARCDMDGQAAVSQQIAQLVSEVQSLPGQILLVSNEVGSGIVPLGELSRQFVDEAGRMNQSLAAVAGRVTLVVAGLPLDLKG